MPEISRFLGIIIAMYYNEHNPPHFHARYGNHKVVIDIETGEARGDFPKRALALVKEWHQQHQDELRVNWELARNDRPLNHIEPLE